MLHYEDHYAFMIFKNKKLKLYMFVCVWSIIFILFVKYHLKQKNKQFYFHTLSI